MKYPFVSMREGMKNLVKKMLQSDPVYSRALPAPATEGCSGHQRRSTIKTVSMIHTYKLELKYMKSI
jgi:hypothetical protein